MLQVNCGFERMVYGSLALPIWHRNEFEKGYCLMTYLPRWLRRIHWLTA